MSTTMLIPLDGSQLAERALTVTIRLARAGQDRLLLVHVASPQGWAGRPAVDTDLVAAVDAAATPLRAAGFAVQTCIYKAISPPRVSSSPAPRRRRLPTWW